MTMLDSGNGFQK